MDEVYSNSTIDDTEGQKLKNVKLKTNKNALKRVLEYQNSIHKDTGDDSKRKFSNSSR